MGILSYVVIQDLPSYRSVRAMDSQPASNTHAASCFRKLVSTITADIGPTRPLASALKTVLTLS